METTRYFVKGRYVEGSKLIGTVANTFDPVVRNALLQREEQVMENGIVVHALPALMKNILGHFSKAGIKPAKIEHR